MTWHHGRGRIRLFAAASARALAVAPARPRARTAALALALALAALAVPVGAAATAATTAATSQPLTWSAPKLIDQTAPFAGRGNLAGVSCPSTSLCVGIDGGEVLTAKGPLGAGWTVGFVDPVTYLQAVSCPSTALCVAVDASGNVLTSSNPAGRAGRWRMVQVDRRPLSSVSCASKRLCVAVDDGGNVVSSTDPRGGAGAWKLRHVDRPDNGSSSYVTCTAPALCVVMVNHGSPATAAEYYDIVTSTHAGSGGWRSVRGPGTGLNITGIVCPSASRCMAGDDGGTVLTSADPGAASSAWHAINIGLTGRIESIACPSVSMCLAGDDQENILSTSDPTGTTPWKSVALTGPNSGNGGGLLALACPSVSECVAADDQGEIFSSGNSAGDSSAWTAKLVPGSSDLRAVACPSKLLCVAIDNAGKVLSSTNPRGGAGAWKATPGLIITPNFETTLGSGPLFDLSCPSTHLCVTAQGGQIVATTNPAGGAQAWKFTSALGNGPIDSLSCPTVLLCVAMDNENDTMSSATFGRVLASTNPAGGTGAWKTTVPQLDPMTTTDYIDNISCPSVHLCVAGGDFQLAITSTNPTGGLSAWRRGEGFPSQLDALSCPAVSLCVGVLDQGAVVSTTHPTGVHPWRLTRLPQHTFLTNLTCPTKSLCVGVGVGAGPGAYLVDSTDPNGGASAWHVTHVQISDSRLESVSCASASFCVAVGGSYVLVGTRPRR